MTLSTVPNLTHIGVYTDQPEAMREFYERTLGLIVSDTGVGRFFPRRIIFMTGDPTQHHQFVLVAREAGDPVGGALFQVSFKVKCLDDLRQIAAKTEQLAAPNVRKINHGNSWSLYFNDPDGNMVEIYMDTGWYVPQPFADVLPLDKTDAEIRQITAERVKHEPGALPQDEWSAQMASKLAIARQRQP